MKAMGDIVSVRLPPQADTESESLMLELETTKAFGDMHSVWLPH